MQMLLTKNRYDCFEICNILTALQLIESLQLVGEYSQYFLEAYQMKKTEVEVLVFSFLRWRQNPFMTLQIATIFLFFSAAFVTRALILVSDES